MYAVSIFTPEQHSHTVDRNRLPVGYPPLVTNHIHNYLLQRLKSVYARLSQQCVELVNNIT